MFGKPPMVCIVCLLLLQISAVWKQYLAKITGRLRAINHSAETVLDKQRQVAAVIDMRVGKDYAFDSGWIAWKRRPVFQPQRLVSLKQPAINQDAPRIMFDQVFRSSDRTVCPEKLNGSHNLYPLFAV